MKITPFHVVIVAAGSGQRMGFDPPKQHKKLNGLSPLERTIKSFKACDGLQKLVVVTDIDIAENCIIVKGSNTRFNSVYSGLKALDDVKSDDIVLIHDAARPFVTLDLIQAVVNTVQTSRAATLSLPVADTIQHKSGEIVPRAELRAIQTPQGFLFVDILKAHENARSQNIEATDDAQLIEALGIQVHHVEGSRMNFKLTTQDDWAMAEQLTSTEFETRTASGFDVHAFDKVENASGVVRLGGIDITHPFKLSGFSDADVVLHAITDALYGTIGEGDIGFHFPPNKNVNKDRDSADFLHHALQLVTHKQGRIINIDITIMCEDPKIGPHREAMRARIADIINIPISRISVKATTTEGLGFTGRREGIAAQAQATITLPRGE